MKNEQLYEEMEKIYVKGACYTGLTLKDQHFCAPYNFLCFNKEDCVYQDKKSQVTFCDVQSHFDFLIDTYSEPEKVEDKSFEKLWEAMGEL